jgi:hypothetical protein
MHCVAFGAVAQALFDAIVHVFFGILQRGDDLAPFFGFHIVWAF